MLELVITVISAQMKGVLKKSEQVVNIGFESHRDVRRQGRCHRQQRLQRPLREADGPDLDPKLLVVRADVVRSNVDDRQPHSLVRLVGDHSL